MNTEYLVTGGAGFIGSNVVEHLVRQGRRVRVLDNFLTGKRENLQGVTGKIDLVEGDLRDLPTVRRVCEGVQYVIHIGALPSVPRSVEDPVLSHEINVTGTLNVLVAARDAKSRRVVFSSSSSVYGDTPTLPKREEMMPAPLSPYAAHKLTGEHYCRIFWQLYGLETVALRYFNVFGPRQDPQSAYAAVIPRFITAILRGESPTVFGDGTQSRDFTHVQNVIEANLAACVAPKEAVGEAYNVAGGDRISLLELIATINGILGKRIAAKFEPRRAGDVLHSQADIAKAIRLLAWKPSVTFRQGIERAVEWYRQQL